MVEVAALLEQGYHVNEFDELSRTPLHYAVEHEHYEVISQLLAAGANVNAHEPSMAGDTPLGRVAATCSLRLAAMLVKAGADPIIPGFMKITALDRARRRKRGDGPLVADLLERVARGR